MNTEQKYQVFQIKPGKPMPVFIDPNDPKGIKAIQAILANPDFIECPRCHEIIEIDDDEEGEFARHLEYMYYELERRIKEYGYGSDPGPVKMMLDRINKFELEHQRRRT